MKKRIFRIMAVVLLACFGMTAIMACNNSEKPNTETTYTVTYSGGEGATGEAPTEASHKAGETFKLKDNTFTKKGYTFSKWNDGSKDYSAGATYKMPANNVVFTAKLINIFHDIQYFILNVTNCLCTAHKSTLLIVR